MTDTPSAGWFPDPMGRATDRYWDGSAWTARVRGGDGEPEGHDPLDAPVGATSSATSGTPASDRGALAGAGGAGAAAATEVVDLLRSGPPRPGLRGTCIGRVRPSTWGPRSLPRRA